MNLSEIILLGVALSADAMSVTLCNMLANPTIKRSRALLMPLLFGLFQGIMPLIGFSIGILAVDYVRAYTGPIACIILGAIGAKMTWDAFHEDVNEEQREAANNTTIAILFVEAIATSIDALAVGVSLAASGADILLSSIIIAICTFFCCLAMVLYGRHAGNTFGKKAQIAGGVVLILLGIKALF